MVKKISTQKSVSIRKCCQVLGQRRASIYYIPKRKNEDKEIASLLREKASQKPYWGFRKLFYSLRNEGRKWNKKKVYRIYKAEKLNLRRPPKRSKIKRKSLNILPPQKINEGWSMDFMSDMLKGEDKQVRILNVLDECSRKVLMTWGQYRISAQKLVNALENLVKEYGAPNYLRCDNGPEFISNKLKSFAQKHQIELKFSAPGKPTQNGLVERLNGTLRTERLNLKYYNTLNELQEDLDTWWNEYNFERPHESLNYVTPQKFIEKQTELQFKLDAA